MARPGSPFASFRQPRRGVLAAVAAPTPSAPATPTTPFPIDTGVALRSLLSWVAVGATKVDIYLDTVNPPVARAVSGHYVGTTYTPTLLPATTYYWQIVAINDGGQTPGPVWSFVTPRATDVLVEMAGELVTARAPIDTLTVREVLSASPNEASLFFRLTAPQGGQSVLIGLGSFDDDDLIFGGEVQAIDNSYVGTPGNQAYPITLIDQTFRINKRRPFGTWVDTSASIIGRYLVAVFAPAFTSNGIQDGLPNISINFDGSADFMACLGQLATAISTAAALGRARVDYGRDVHLYLGSEGIAPDVIDADHPVVPNDPPIVFSVDHSQIRTRVYGKGAGSTVPCDVAAGETILPLADVAFFEPVGGQVIGSTAAGAAQTEIVSYTGVQPGGGGSLVGPGAAPSVAPMLALAAGTGLGAGLYTYEYTDVTPSGESLPSPVGTITTGVVAPPTTNGPTPTVLAGAGVNPGTQEYEYTFVNSAGETTPSPALPPVSTHDVPPPASSGTASNNPSGFVNQWHAGDAVYFALAFVNAAGETTVGPVTNTVTAVVDSFFPPLCCSIEVADLEVSTDATVSSRRLYINVNGSWIGYAALNATSTFAGISGANVAGSPLGSNTAFVRQVSLAVIPLGGPTTTARRIYRRFNGSGTFKLVTTLPDNTTTSYLDSIANASLGGNAPSANTATAQNVSVTGIAVGPTPTTSRKLYRTAVGSTQLKLLATIADNTTTTYPDSAADGSLGANAPTGDTSGLTQPSGQVNAGSTSLLVASAGPFSANGGWALVSGGQTIRYTGAGIVTPPASPMTAVIAAGAGVDTGVHLYAYTFVTINGESAPSPTASVTTGSPNNQVALTNVAVGPPGTLYRNLYRTLAGGTVLKFVATVTDNVLTSVGTDVHTDAAIAGNQNAPSGAASLTGIPASGIGSITTTLAYGSPVLPAPALMGINAWNGLTRAIAKGSAINLWVQRDDLEAQAALGALELDDDGNPTDGIREYTVTDARRTDSLNDLCDSNLAIFSRPIVSVAYQTTRKTHAGNTVSINLAYAGGQWGLVGDFTIQAVDLAFRNGVPRWTVKAASVAFTLSELLRRAVIG